VLWEGFNVKIIAVALHFALRVRAKGKFHTITDHEWPIEYLYSFFDLGAG
jgi:hypothetical protein